MHITDPLPQRYGTEEPGVGGLIKQRPEDFIVEEIPLYEPCGEGEHLYLRIRKRGVAHAELMGRLRRHFNVPERAIGYAGMKDKHAVTSQTVSVHLPADPPSIELDHERIEVLWADRHRNKIKRGHLRANRFSICIRDVDPLGAIKVQRTLQRLVAHGAPAYFGSQRFGYRHNNHRLGRLVLHQAWQAILDELLGTRGAEYPEYQHERRVMFDEGRFADAAAEWTTADRAELIACRAIANGRDPAGAVRMIGRTMLTFWTSALSSAIYNRILDERLVAGTIDRLHPGDVAFKHANRAAFLVTPEDMARGDLEERLADLEVSPSGPLWGDGLLRASGATDATECAALAAADVTPEAFARSRYGPEGSRRPLRTPVRNPEIEGGFDEHGPLIRVAFDLPRGMYATVVLREIMKH